MRKLSLLFILGIFSIVSAACGEKEYVDPLEDGVLTVGMECAYAPYNWTVQEQSGTAVKIDGMNQYCDGYDVKIAQTIADELDVQLVVKALNWDGIIQSLITEEIDVIIAGMSPTAKRKQTIAFSNPYYRGEQVVVVKAGGDYVDATSINDFSGAMFSAQRSTLQEDLLDQMNGIDKQDPKIDYTTLVGAVKAGEIDGYIAELPVAKKHASTNSDLVIIQFTEGNGFVLSDEQVVSSIGLRQEDSELQQKINNILSEISDDTRKEWMLQYTNISPEE